MKESGDSASTRHHQSRRRRRRLLLFSGGCLLLLLVLGVVILVLYLTLFMPHDPTTELVSSRVAGVSPRITITPTVRIEINVTLDLDVLVHNPNRATFEHAQGHTILRYRGTQVGDADVAPGRVPQRGDGHVQLTLRVEGDRLAADLGSLIADVAAGELAFDSSTRIPGRLIFLGFIKHHAVAESECHMVIGVPDLKVKSQECSHETKL